MTAQHPSAVPGRWRIVGMDGSDDGYIDVLRPRHTQFNPDGGYIEFGAVQIGLDWYGHAGARFSFQGSGEGDEVYGNGDAEIEDDGTLQGEIRFHHGDDMPFIARRERLPACCQGAQSPIHREDAVFASTGN